MKTRINTWILVLLSALLSQVVAAQQSAWQDVQTVDSDNAAGRLTSQRFSLMPSKYRLLRLNESLIQGQLATASRGAAGTSVVVPLPDGRDVTLMVSEDSIMEPGLAAKFPNIKTYKATSAGENVASGRLDYTPKGFHGMLDTENGTVFIDPRSDSSGRYYVSYFKRDYHPAEKAQTPMQCHVDEEFLRSFAPGGKAIKKRPRLSAQALPIGGTLRNYRLAVATVGEYTVLQGGVAGALAAITTTINRVNQIYIRDLSIKLNLVANNDLIVYPNPATDPYQNIDTGAELARNQTAIDDQIQSANYDLGHLFLTAGGGLAGPGPCQNGFKASGLTGSANPVGDPFDIDFVAHEIGHQFSAQHTFNAVTNACGGGNRSGPTAHEPGSGVTIMGYAGICGTNNLQANSDAMFSAISIEEITDYSVGGAGDTCDVPTATGNTPPVANAGATGNIPANTPFELIGSGTDGNGNALTYSWEQFDAGAASNVNVDTGNNAIFRPFLPTASRTRVFPKLSAVLQGATSTFGEVLPNTSRSLNFRLVVRDNLGGVNSAPLALSVRNTGQPFAITSQNTATSIAGGNPVNISWNVAGTTAAPISCSSVNISLSLDGGNTFPIQIINGTPNDGFETVTLPNVTQASNLGRLKVKCATSVFFDINNANLTVQTGTGGGNTPIAPIQLLLLND